MNPDSRTACGHLAEPAWSRRPTRALALSSAPILRSRTQEPDASDRYGRDRSMNRGSAAGIGSGSAPSRHPVTRAASSRRGSGRTVATRCARVHRTSGNFHRRPQAVRQPVDGRGPRLSRASASGTRHPEGRDRPAWGSVASLYRSASCRNGARMPGAKVCSDGTFTLMQNGGAEEIRRPPGRRVGDVDRPKAGSAGLRPCL